MKVTKTTIQLYRASLSPVWQVMEPLLILLGYCILWETLFHSTNKDECIMYIDKHYYAIYNFYKNFDIYNIVFNFGAFLK